MFIIAARWILEGERDYGDQTLATPTLQRAHVFRGVVHVVLVSVKVQCVKSEFCLWQAEKSFIPSPEPHLRTTNKSLVLLSVVFWWPGSHSTKLRVWPRQNNDLWIVRFFCYAQMCLWWWHKAHVSVFSFFMNRKYATPTWSERHLQLAHSKPIDAYKHLWSKMLLPLQDVVATVYETAARIGIREDCVTVV